MRFYKPVILFFFLLIEMAPLCLAQVTKSARSGKYSVPKVSHNKARIVCPIFEESQYPYQGIGFKVGDPFALTYNFIPRSIGLSLWMQEKRRVDYTIVIIGVCLMTMYNPIR